MNQRTIRVRKNNRTQFVSLPRDLRFPEGVKEVFIHKEGENIILSPRPRDWSDFLSSNIRASDDFMAGVESVPLQQRKHAQGIG